MTKHLRLAAAMVVLALVTGCAPSSTNSPGSPSSSASGPPATAAAPSLPAPGTGSLVIVGRIVTMDEPPVAEALLIEDGTVAAVGTRDEVLALRRRRGSRHRHRGERRLPRVHRRPRPLDRGPRATTDVGSPAAKPWTLALTRGWTSISEQWVNQERLDELTALAADDALPLRVDAYLALNFDKEFFGDWYAIARAGPRRRPPPRPGCEDPPGQWLGHDRELGAGGAHRHDRQGERGGLAGLGPQPSAPRRRRSSSTPSRRRSGRPGPIRSTTGSSTPSR